MKPLFQGLIINNIQQINRMRLRIPVRVA